MMLPLRPPSSLACLLVLGLAQTAPALAQDKAKAEASATVSVEISDIETVGSSIDAETLRAIFNGDIAAHAEALAALRAESITIPRIEVTFTRADRTDTVVYSDIVISDVEDGVAAALAMGGSTIAYSEGAAVTMGTMRAADFNIAGSLAYYGLVPAADPEAFVPLYRDLHSAGGNLAFEDGECAIGEASMAAFSARPLRTSLIDILAFAESLDADGDVDPDALGNEFASLFRLLYGDLMMSFETSELRFESLACHGTNDKGGQFDFTLGPITIDAFTPGFYPAITIADLTLAGDVDGAPGVMSLAEMRFKGLDYTNLAAALLDMPVDAGDEWVEANIHHFIPNFRGFSIAGLDVDVPSEEYAENVRFSLGSFDLELDSYETVIPTSIRSALRNFVMDVRPYMEADEAEDIAAFMEAAGIDALDMSYTLDLAWDAASEVITLDTLGVEVAGVGSVRLSGALANAAASLFSLNETAVMFTAMGLTLTDLSLDVADSGVIGAALKLALAESGNAESLTPEQFRPVFATTMGLALRSELTAVGYGAVADAIIAFLREGEALTITARARDGGVGMFDFMLAEDDPAALLAKFDIKARVR